MYIVKTENHWVKVKDIFFDREKLHKTIQENWSVQIMWFPFNGISTKEALKALLQRKISENDWDPMNDDVWVRTTNRYQQVVIY